MQLNSRQLLILSGKICPYCGKDTAYVDSEVVYRQSYGMIYLCADCLAWVGVHKGTDNALGRLADKELREWKIKAHAAFDPIWQTGIMKRGHAYHWLAKMLDIPDEYCHMGYFSVATCKRVVEIIESSLEQLKQQYAKR